MHFKNLLPCKNYKFFYDGFLIECKAVEYMSPRIQSQYLKARCKKQNRLSGSGILNSQNICISQYPGWYSDLGIVLDAGIFLGTHHLKKVFKHLLGELTAWEFMCGTACKRH